MENNLDPLVKIIRGLKVNDVNKEMDMDIAKNEPTPLDEERMAQVIFSRNKSIIQPPYSITRNRKLEVAATQEQNKDTDSTK